MLNENPMPNKPTTLRELEKEFEEIIWDLDADDKGKAKGFLSTFADKVKEAVEEENAQSLKDILNRCKTERGLGVAIANFIKTLTK